MTPWPWSSTTLRSLPPPSMAASRSPTLPPGRQYGNFIRMDPPRHTAQRKTVAPIATPAHIAKLEGLIRERTARVLDGLPRNEAFDWVDKVSIELTTMMLATLFDFPWEDRRLLPYWSDVAVANL